MCQLIPIAGLPEVWEQQAGDVQFAARAFDVGGVFPPVKENVHLVKGLFSDSLPPFLQLQVWCMPSTRPWPCILLTCA